MKRRALFIGAVIIAASAAMTAQLAQGQNCASSYEMGRSLGSSGTGQGQMMYNNMLNVARSAGCEQAFIAGNRAGFAGRRDVGDPASEAPGPGRTPTITGPMTPPRPPIEPTPVVCNQVPHNPTNNPVAVDTLMREAYFRFQRYVAERGQNDPVTINTLKEYQCYRGRLQYLRAVTPYRPER